MNKYIVKADMQAGGVVRNTPRTDSCGTDWSATGFY